MKKFSFRLGDIEARTAMLNPTDSKETVEIVEWGEDTCRVLAFFQPEYEQERCVILQPGIYYENTKDLMRVIRIANKFLGEEHQDD